MKVNRSRLEALTHEKGWSQKQMAKELGIHQTSFNAMMRGRRQVGAKSIGKFMRLFPEEHMNQLFNWED